MRDRDVRPSAKGSFRSRVALSAITALLLVPGCGEEGASADHRTDAGGIRDAGAPRQLVVDATPRPADRGPADAAVPALDQGAAPADAGPGDAAAPRVDAAPTPVDAAPSAADAAQADVGPAAQPTAASCFAPQLPGGQPLVDYDAWGPRMGSHCKGTDHQDIAGVEHVVFVGDSVTVGTPPTPEQGWYRNVVAEALAAEWGLEAPAWPWSGADVINGVGAQRDSGAFSVCAKWGARTDDIYREPHQQLQTCLPEAVRDQTTLVVMTVGGNDLFSWAQDLVAGESIEVLQMQAERAVADLEEAVRWLTDDPARFPNGVFLVFANTFEFTDADSARDFSTCPGADLIGMDRALVDPAFQAMATWMAGEYLRIAVETGTDMVFMGEHFCGHGHMRADPTGRCHRGPDAELWLDVTCIHPSAEGHAGIADLFLAVIRE